MLKIHDNIKTGFKIIGVRLAKGFEDDISILQPQSEAELGQKLCLIEFKIYENKKFISKSIETGLKTFFNATSKMLDASLKAQYISLGELLNKKEVRFESRIDDMMNCLTEKLRALVFRLKRSSNLKRKLLIENY
jgi:hypothetical protein